MSAWFGWRRSGQRSGVLFLLAVLILTIAFAIAWRVTLSRSRSRVAVDTID